MRIGLDLDNTIICYDASFHRVAHQKKLLPESIGVTKEEVKTWVVEQHGNDAWTELQGLIYGEHLQAATAYPGALEFVRRCRADGHSICILSHKTQFPVRGKKIDLRLAALDWLETNGWFGDGAIKREEVEFYATRAEKVGAISLHACEIFIDDLPEVFAEAHFPASVTRILFDPENIHANLTQHLRMQNWDEITRAVFFSDLKLSVAGGATCQGDGLVKLLLDRAGLLSPRVIQPLQGGRNNKVFRVSTSTCDVLFKSYFHTAGDTRDRLGREFDFLNHLARVGSRFSARPLAFEQKEHVAIMEFIEGIRPALAEVNEAHIDQAIAFFFEANQQLDAPLALKIEPASEACFTMARHLAVTQARVDRLDQIVIEDDIDAEAAHFAQHDLLPTWSEARAAIDAAWSTDKAREAVLPQTERCLSPSDFGFHNSLRQPDGKLRFVDFEYAGWDDPAKLIVDFANQPDMLLAQGLSDRFRAAVISANANPSALARRVAALEPLYQIKWACICLNDFLEFGRKRLQFTDGSAADPQVHRQRQLAKGRQMLGRVSGLRLM